MDKEDFRHITLLFSRHSHDEFCLVTLPGVQFVDISRPCLMEWLSHRIS